MCVWRVVKSLLTVLLSEIAVMSSLERSNHLAEDRQQELCISRSQLSKQLPAPGNLRKNNHGVPHKGLEPNKCLDHCPKPHLCVPLLIPS